MKKEEVMQIIRKRINSNPTLNFTPNDEYEPDTKYDGFDMSGYNNSVYSNLELLARFGDLINLNCSEDNRDSNVHIPFFCCNLFHSLNS